MNIKAKKIILSLLTFSITCSLALGVPTSTKAASTSDMQNANLLNTYGKVFGKAGNILASYQFSNGNIINYAKKEYNSITLENEMKPDAILGYSANQISIAEAKSLGYYIPDNYPESTVPKLNFTTVDKMLKTCYDNGLSMRGHTLVWHSQTPDWYFKSGYNQNAGYVNQNVMNKRMEFYIKTVMGHAFSSQYGSVIYAWDVVNEFLHAESANPRSGWQQIYGKVNTSPAFVKDAFKYAYETLEKYKLTDKVKLFYNDYNEYMEVNNIISLINYINSGKKTCAGIGMQSHLTTKFPSVAYYKSALDAFAKAGFEIQITELDVGATSSSEQSKYYYDLMSAILSSKKAGANITALVWWGLSDDVSWRKNEKPLLYSNYTTKKESYNSVIKAYFDAGYTLSGGTSTGGSGTSTGGSGTSTGGSGTSTGGSGTSTGGSGTTTGGSGTTTGSTQTLLDGWYYIKNVNAQKYLQVANNTGKAGQNVELGTGKGVLGQRWYLSNVGNGYITLKSALGNFKLDVSYGENKDGANIQIYNSYETDGQKFSVKPSLKAGAYIITTASSKQTKALDDFNFGTADGTNVCQWTVGGYANQQWIFESVKN